MHDAPGGDGDLIPAGLALEQLPGRFPVRFSPSAARADKPLGPARINQVLEARFVRIKAALEIENGAWEVGARHLSPLLNHPVTTLPLGVMGVNPIRRRNDFAHTYLVGRSMPRQHVPAPTGSCPRRQYPASGRAGREEGNLTHEEYAQMAGALSPEAAILDVERWTARIYPGLYVWIAAAMSWLTVASRRLCTATRAAYVASAGCSSSVTVRRASSLPSLSTRRQRTFSTTGPPSVPSKRKISRVT